MDRLKAGGCKMSVAEMQGPAIKNDRPCLPKQAYHLVNDETSYVDLYFHYRQSLPADDTGQTVTTHCTPQQLSRLGWLESMAAAELLEGHEPQPRRRLTAREQAALDVAHYEGQLQLHGAYSELTSLWLTAQLIEAQTRLSVASKRRPYTGKTERLDAETIKAENDITEVIGRYIPLRKLGQQYRGRCPFHNDHDPSFYVSPAKQLWSCFGCGAGGDVITFIQKIENCDFIDALKILAGER